MTIVPRARPCSAMPDCLTTSTYQAGKSSLCLGSLLPVSSLTNYLDDDTSLLGAIVFYQKHPLPHAEAQPPGDGRQHNRGRTEQGPARGLPPGLHASERSAKIGQEPRLVLVDYQRAFGR